MKPLKRHPALIELSREHHHALSLCVRLLRTPAESHQTELEAHFLELEPHFAEEEVMFAPYWQNIPAAMRERFEKEHAKLRGMMANPKYPLKVNRCLIWVRYSWMLIIRKILVII